MKPFNVLGRFATCLLGMLGVCMASPESAVAKVKNIQVSTQGQTVHGNTERPEKTQYQKLTCDGYLWITADTDGNTLVYNSENGFSNNSDDLIDLSSPEIVAMNTGNENPKDSNWNRYEITIVGDDESKASPIHVKMDSGAIGRLVLGDKSNTISTSTIDLEITGGTIDQFIFAGKVSDTCNVTMKDCRLAGAYGPVRDTDFSLTMDMSKLNMTLDKSVTYTHPRFIFEDLMPLVTDGAKIDLPYRPNSDNVYEINDSVDFYWFEAYVDEKINDINGKLMNDIKVSKHTMVGSHTSPFKGKFDGNGHTISGLQLGSYIGKIDNSTQYAGLFGFVQGTADKHAVIQNLTVEGKISIISSPLIPITNLKVGGVVGIADQYVEVMDVVSNVNIDVHSMVDHIMVKTHLGGIVGSTEYSASANGPLYIDRCTYRGYISQGGYYACGGIVGYISKGHIHDCFNAGTITNINYSQQAPEYPSWVSGILGYTDNSTSDGANGFTLKRCINVGTVSANDDACKPACYAIAYANSCTAAAFAQLYYKAGTATAATGGSAKYGTSIKSVTDDQLKSGEVTYALNESSSSNPAWRQTIGTDTIPVLDKTHKMVYYGYANCSATTISYINVDHPNQGHCYADGACKYCKVLDVNYLTVNSDGYYELNNALELVWFAAYVNKGNTSAKAKLMADITLPASWTPINAFTGTFDGQGHTVYGVSISSTSNYVGFVGRNRGTIKNLIIGSGTIRGYRYCGGICGMNEGTISNCANFAIIGKYTTPTLKSYFGGICGLSTGSTARVENCYNFGTINVTTSGSANASFLGFAENNAQFIYCCYRPQSGNISAPSFPTVFSCINSEFKNGIVTYRLNHDSSTNPVWRQNLGQDNYPVLDVSHKVVYKTYANCTTTLPYSNENNGHTKQGHSWDDGTITTQPTCTAKGEITYTCAFNCGTPRSSDIEANGHTEVDMDAVQPTCTAIGLTAGKYCSVCQDTLVAQTEIPALGHTRGELQSDFHSHWYPCEVCTDKLDYENHNHDAEDHSCSLCLVDVPSFTADSCLLIGYAKQLAWFAAYVKADHGSVNARLTDNISDVGNIMIGTHEHPFMGEFDGDGFKISGLNQTSNFGKYEEKNEYAGLFGFVQGESATEHAVIRNLTIEGTIRLDSTESNTEFFAIGGLVGIADQYVEISDILSNVVIKNDRSIKTHIGGIVGTTEYGGTYEPIYVDRCIYRGTILQRGKNACGGIVGFIKNGHIHDCVNAGTITNVGNISGSRVCGILGYVNNSSAVNFTMKNCLNIGEVSGDNSIAICYANNCPKGALDNLYYKERSADSAAKGSATFGTVQSVTTDQLKSGEITYALNSNYSEETPVWYQNLSGAQADTVPVLDPSHKRVVRSTGYSYTIADGKQYGTFCYGADAALPEGMSAFSEVYAINDRIFGMKIEDGMIPAGTPVILRKPSKVGAMTISVAEGYHNALRQLGDTCVSGQLVGLLKVTAGQTLPKSTDQGSTYTMQTQTINDVKVQNFYRIESDNMPATQYRCYLDLGIQSLVEMSAQSRAVCIFDNETTGLQSLSADDQSQAPVFNLHGQRVQHMDRGGIYVQGNKKTMIK